MGKTRILVVDDESGICDIIKKLLSAKHYRVFCATKPAEAIAAINKEHPHLVFLDIRLGENISGLDVLPKLKELDKKLKIIMLTGLEDVETIRKAKAQGADDFISKPFDLECLDFIVSQTLQRLSMRKESPKTDHFRMRKILQILKYSFKFVSDSFKAIRQNINKIVKKVKRQ